MSDHGGIGGEVDRETSSRTDRTHLDMFERNSRCAAVYSQRWRCLFVGLGTGSRLAGRLEGLGGVKTEENHTEIEVRMELGSLPERKSRATEANSVDRHPRTLEAMAVS